MEIGQIIQGAVLLVAIAGAFWRLDGRLRLVAQQLDGHIASSKERREEQARAVEHIEASTVRRDVYHADRAAIEARVARLEDRAA